MRICSREHLIGMAGQVREQLEFTCRQLDLAGIALDATGAQVEADIAGLKHRRFALCGHAQLRTDACEQLLQRKRLGDVVVGAAVQPLDLLFDRTTSGQQDDRQLWLARPDGIQDVQAVPARQHHVEQDEPVVAGERLELGAPTVVDDGDGVALGMQALLDEARQGALILDDQDAHLAAHASGASRRVSPKVRAF
ncbi:MAG TPA: hypothetical protein VJ608_06025 [Albitalea sp.]|nr:hypothetical protein [Albitalea sp.]